MRRLVAVVEDNGLTRVLLRDALDELGYDALLFESADEALAAFARAVPAACVVDHLMPGTSGAELVAILRRSVDRRLSRLPVVGLTSRFDRELQAAGADACISKPFTVTRLGEALDAAFAARGGEQPLTGLVERFSALHAAARAGTLPASRLPAYRALRADLARALVAIQNLGGKDPRRGRVALRMPASLPVQVAREGLRLDAVTGDVGAGGFSALLAPGLRRGMEVTFRLGEPGREVEGRARVSNVTPAGPGRERVGFAFDGLSEAARDEAEALVFDEVMARPSCLSA